MWKGVTASYYGICETMIHWMVYEYLKKELAEYKARMMAAEGVASAGGGGGLSGIDMFGLMGCGACSRLCATAIAYPHGATFFIISVMVVLVDSVQWTAYIQGQCNNFECMLIP